MDRASGKSKTSPLIAILITAGALALFFALYSPARNMGFYFDDRVTILQNEKIHSDSPLTAMGENPFRSLVNLTFWAQLQLHRPNLPAADHDLAHAAPNISRRLDPTYQRDLAFFTDPAAGHTFPVSIDPGRGLVFAMPPAFPFRIFNLALHALNAFLLWLILRRLAPAHTAAPAIAALAFLWCPLATESVNYITARFGLMATAFSLAAVLAHLAADQNPKRDRRAVVLFLAALLCKETAVTLPLLVFGLDLARGKPSARPLLALAVSGLYGALRLNWQIELGPAGGEILSGPMYLLVQQRIIWIYLAKALLPIHLNFEHHVIADLLSDLPFALVNFALLAGSTYVVLRTWQARPRDIAGPPPPARDVTKKSGRRTEPKQVKILQPDEARAPRPNWTPEPLLLWAAAGVLMVFLSLAPTSSVLPLADLIREDRAYSILPIVISGLVFMLFQLRLPATFPAKRLATAAVVLVCFATLTGERNRHWSSELALARDSVRKSPFNPRAVFNYAVALKWSGKYRQAMDWSQRTLELDPSRTDAATDLEVLRKLMRKSE